MDFDYIDCGNCLDLMKELPDESIDMVMTSPPYDDLRNYNGYSFDFENIAKELFRVVKQGDVVLDNCMGSGSTCVACANTKRHYIGFEKEPKYFEIACKRLDEAEGVENDA